MEFWKKSRTKSDCWFSLRPFKNMMQEQTRISCPTLLVKEEMGDGLGLENDFELNRTVSNSYLIVLQECGRGTDLKQLACGYYTGNLSVLRKLWLWKTNNWFLLILLSTLLRGFWIWSIVQKIMSCVLTLKAWTMWPLEKGRSRCSSFQV